jgi:hypothetical protein
MVVAATNKERILTLTSFFIPETAGTGAVTGTGLGAGLLTVGTAIFTPAPIFGGEGAILA